MVYELGPSVSALCAAGYPANIAAGAVPLAGATRGHLVESVHLGHAIRIDSDGSQTVQGNAEHVMYGRSTAKAFQTLAMVNNGLDLPPHLLALVCASHSAEIMHRAGVEEILSMHGLDVGHLQCTPSLPIGKDSHDEWLATGRGREPIAHDCSGKHSGMLATCAINDWPVDSYLEFDHPLQLAIRETMASKLGDGGVVSVDGCGAPLFSHTLKGLAQGYRELAMAPEGTPEFRVAEAMRRFPHMVAGTGRSVTHVAQELPGFLAKDGAEAVFVLASTEGKAAAIKILDGNSRAIGAVVLAIVQEWGDNTERLTSLLRTPILGHGEPVGAIYPLTAPQ